MDLQEIRNEIDRVDDQLLRLFEERMDLAAEVANAKAKGALPVENTTREREILARVAREAKGETAPYSQTLFTTLFDLSKNYQRQLAAQRLESRPALLEALEVARQNPPLFPKGAVVACQGVAGAYSQLACDKLFETPDILYFRSFEGVFAAVEKGLCQYGILPVENSTAGSVTAVYDLMHRFHFTIVRSVKLRVDHCLVAKPGTRLGDITAIYSHEQALAQCDQYLKSLEGVAVHAADNTAAAAEMVANAPENNVAAISSRECAKLYGLSVLDTSMQDKGDNYTRFICIAKAPGITADADKISLMLTVPHKPGSLYRLMSRFAALNINLLKLESRPLPDSLFEFMFYFDLAASTAQPAVAALLGELSETLDTFVFLGSYKEVE